MQAEAQNNQAGTQSTAGGQPLPLGPLPVDPFGDNAAELLFNKPLLIDFDARKPVPVA